VGEHYRESLYEAARQLRLSRKVQCTLSLRLARSRFNFFLGAHGQPGTRSNSGMDLFALTGWLPEEIYFDDFSGSSPPNPVRDRSSEAKLEKVRTCPTRRTGSPPAHLLTHARSLPRSHCHHPQFILRCGRFCTMRRIILGTACSQPQRAPRMSNRPIWVSFLSTPMLY
jgi:hypothetical protein